MSGKSSALFIEIGVTIFMCGCDLCLLTEKNKTHEVSHQLALLRCLI